MSDNLSHFRTADDAAAYNRLYDELVARLWLVPHEEHDIATTFGSTRVRRSGPPQGEPLVLIHPTAGSSLGWHGLVPLLCEHHPVYTPDTIGTAGRSVQTAPVTSEHDLVVWLGELLDGLGLERVHLVGYSEGGWIAALFAALAEGRARLATLTLIEPAGAIERIPAPFLFEMVARGAATLWAKDKRKAVQGFNRWLNGDIELTEDEIDLLLAVFGRFTQRLPKAGRLTDDQLRRIQTPTLLLMGADTKLYDPDKVAARVRELLPDTEVEITPHAGHGLAVQFPQQVAARILRFIEDQSASHPTE